MSITKLVMIMRVDRPNEAGILLKNLTKLTILSGDANIAGDKQAFDNLFNEYFGKLKKITTVNILQKIYERLRELTPEVIYRMQTEDLSRNELEVLTPLFKDAEGDLEYGDAMKNLTQLFRDLVSKSNLPKEQIFTSNIN